jgi:hypothetical protein
MTTRSNNSLSVIRKLLMTFLISYLAWNVVSMAVEEKLENNRIEGEMKAGKPIENLIS